MHLEAAFREAVGPQQPLEIVAIVQDPKYPRVYLALWRWGEPPPHNSPYNVSPFKVEDDDAVLMRSSIYGLGMVEALELLIKFITTDKAYR